MNNNIDVTNLMHFCRFDAWSILPYLNTILSIELQTNQR